MNMAIFMNQLFDSAIWMLVVKRIGGGYCGLRFAWKVVRKDIDCTYVIEGGEGRVVGSV